MKARKLWNLLKCLAGQRSDSIVWIMQATLSNYSIVLIFVFYSKYVDTVHPVLLGDESILINKHHIYPFKWPVSKIPLSWAGALRSDHLARNPEAVLSSGPTRKRKQKHSLLQEQQLRIVVLENLSIRQIEWRCENNKIFTVWIFSWALRSTVCTVIQGHV